MRIALAQMRVKANDPESNFNGIKEYLERARLQGAQAVVFPELCLPGYFVGDAWERGSFLRECESLGREVARLAPGLHVFFGNVGVDWERRNEDGRARKYNALFHAFEGELIRNEAIGLPFWPKTLLPGYREFDDARHFFDLRKLALERGVPLETLLAPHVIETESGPLRLALSICEDGWSEDYPHDPVSIIASRGGVDLIVNASCSPFTLGKQSKRERMMGALCARISAPMVYVNCTGMQNNGKTIYGFDGSSAVFGARGEVTARAAFFSPELLMVARDAQGAWTPCPRGADASMHAPLQSREDALRTALESILRHCKEEWKLERVVVGASGGIDSALSATLCARVFGPRDTYLINMPSRFNSALTRTAAHDLARNLGCPFAVAPIEDGIELTERELRAANFGAGASPLNVTQHVLENVQARDRGARVLAGIAASLGAVFTCNANKSELTVGYSTLYGDQAGFLAPIADLWKGDVYGLARHYNEVVFRRETIPLPSIEVVPSAELSEAQDVTQGKGDPLCYPFHDKLFAAWVEHWDRKTPFDCLEAYVEGRLAEFLGCDDALVARLFPTAESFCVDLERWWAQYQGLGAFKRVQAPPVVAVTRRAYGFDHREHVGGGGLGRSYALLKSKLLADSGARA